MAPSTIARSLAPVLTLVLLSAGCGSLPNVPLPTKPAAAASLASRAPGTASSGAPSARRQVLAAYLGYWQAYSAALRTRNIAAARNLLARYADTAFLSQVTAPLTRVWAAHLIGYGSAEPHVLSVAPTGSTALLHDCLNLSHFGTQDIRTGRIVPGSFGLPTVNFYVTMTRSGRPHSGKPRSGQPGSGQHWVISKMQQVEVPCTP